MQAIFAGSFVLMRLAAYQPDLAPNLGAMVRLCACTGVGLDIIEPCGFPFSLKALRNQALDYASHVDICRHDDWSSFVPQGRVVLLSTSGAVPIWDFRFLGSDTLLVGRESAGVPLQVRAEADAVVTIPMPGPGRSLNVAMAAAITLYEALRQANNGEMRGN